MQLMHSQGAHSPLLRHVTQLLDAGLKLCHLSLALTQAALKAFDQLLLPLLGWGDNNVLLAVLVSRRLALLLLQYTGAGRAPR